MRKVVLGLLVAGSFAFTACNDATSKIGNGEAEAGNGAEAAVSGAETTAGTPQFEFAEERWDFGDVEEGQVAKHTFTFTNTGDAPLIIYNAQGSCGCTVPEWPREAIAPGGTGEIKVSFNSQGRPGVNNKQVTLTTNTVPNKKVLSITTNVIGKAAAEGAENAQK